ncbi:MAG: HisA/HisF-related TIM barrel protein [Gemmataceae bacterium]
MRLIPVLDLMAGQVVHGMAGQRHLYRPVQSKLTPSCRPVDVAMAFGQQLRLTELYVADLDAIAGAVPAFAVFTELQQAGFRLWVDAGVCNWDQARPLLESGIETLVVGLETVDGPEALARIVKDCADRIVFSLDLKDGKPLGNLNRWARNDPVSIALAAIEYGVHRILILDLSRVGSNEGTGTDELAARLLAEYPRLEVTVGGGIRGVDDLLKLRDKGVAAALVATALHNRTIRAEHLAQFS